MSISENNTEEFYTFTITTRDGGTAELAVVDEFDFEKKHYAVCALVVEDTISEEGRFIYRCKVEDDEPVFEKINNAIDYQKIAEAYMEMDDDADL